MGLLWSPWHGCHRCSPGCKNCYVYYLDSIHDKDANVVQRSKTGFNLPLKKSRTGEYKIRSGSEVATCFTSDFFLEEADEWREEAYKIIKARPDVKFLICTKRPERIAQCLPADWGDGYLNVGLAVTCENQAMAEKRLKIFENIKAAKKFIFVAPILEYVDLKKFLKTKKFDRVSVGGESYTFARECNFEWVKKIYADCRECEVEFEFHQTGSNFVKDGKTYKIKHKDEYSQAKKAEEFLKNEYEKLI